MGDYKSSDFSELSKHTEGQAEHDSLYSNPIQQVSHLREKGESDEEIERFLREKYDEDQALEIMGMDSISRDKGNYAPESKFRSDNGDTLTYRQIGYIGWKGSKNVTGHEDGFLVGGELYRPIDQIESDSGRSGDPIDEERSGSTSLSDFE